MGSRVNTRKLVFMSLMVSYGLAMYLLESFVPNPLIALFPGAKLGFSNIITLLCLLTLDFKQTFIILTVRVILSSIFAGPMSYFLFSVAGGYLSLFGMFFIMKVKGVSEIGISVVGAICHNIGQLLVASAIIKNIAIVSYLPFMILASVLTGIFVGMVAKYTKGKLEKQIKKLGLN